MKPINLKIKGLNSFIETQEINFEKLTEKGLFGIFGPTGSGKSTILDGITLALYGEVSRKSTNYMNTNCDTMNVSYEFQMTEKEIKRYRVDREFKRDTKTDSIKSKSAKIIDVTNGEIVLEDKIRLVTKKCEDIIGLKLEDFTRTVVLPQGKFSEFLKLEGRERRDMLERLFNLHKYGDDLSYKLGDKIKQEYQKSNVLDGELKSYEDISDEILEEKNKELKETKNQCEKCLASFKDAENSFNEGKKLWDLQLELIELENKEKSLKKQEEEINKNQLKVELGESALKVKPYIDGYENTLRQIEIVSKDIIELKAKLEEITKDKEKAEKLFDIAKNNKDTELPELKVKEQKILDAIEEKKSLDILIREKITLEKSIKILEENLVDTNNKIETKDKSIINLNDSIISKENKVESLKVPEEYKDKVNDGFLLLNSYESLAKQKDKHNKDIRDTSINMEEASKKSEALSKLLNEKEESYNAIDEALKKLISNCPGDQDSLLSLKEKLINIEDKWNKNKEYNLSIDKSREKIETIKKELLTLEQGKTALEVEIKNCNDIIKKTETENLAHTLRGSLLDGDVCPVCGSKEHHKENIEILCITNTKQLKLDLSKKEDNFNKITAEIIKFQTNMKTEEDNINDNEGKLKDLGDEYKSFSVNVLKKDFKKLYDDINTYNSEKSDLEKKSKILQDEKSNLLLEYNKANSTLIHNKEQLINLQDELKLKIKEIDKIEKELNLLKSEISVEDFKKAKDEINKKETEKNFLEKEIRIFREKLNGEQQQKEKLISLSTDLKVELKEKNTSILEKNKSIEEKQKSIEEKQKSIEEKQKSIEEKQKNIEEKQKNIKSKAWEAENLEEIKNYIAQTIKKIEKEYIDSEKQKNEIEKLFNDCNGKIISSQGNLVSLKERSSNDKEALEKAMSEENIINMEEAKRNFITKSEIDNLKSQIENYKNSMSQLTGALDSIKRKIDGRNLTEEQWLNIQNTKNEIAEMINSLTEKNINLETEVKTIIVRIESKKELVKRKNELDYKLSLLNDLDKLFRGKKFIEFVAANQLKYVSIEASKKLKEITGGVYGLEVDDNGKFLIRDYKNGGAQRDASTLSGGETFVASLALALALSSQIQLKGTAPLELFFLDEGFGTLDDNLLDVVMDSLEKIHNDKLSIGIISHVESIKNRVPVKLIVTPAEAGMGGSKVKIERN